MHGEDRVKNCGHAVTFHNVIYNIYIIDTLLFQTCVVSFVRCTSYITFFAPLAKRYNHFLIFHPNSKNKNVFKCHRCVTVRILVPAVCAQRTFDITRSLIQTIYSDKFIHGEILLEHYKNNNNNIILWPRDSISDSRTYFFD